MQSQPTGYDAQLFRRKRAGRQLPIYGKGSPVFTKVDMDVRLMMLLTVHVDHLDDNSEKSSRLWHAPSFQLAPGYPKAGAALHRIMCRTSTGGSARIST